MEGPFPRGWAWAVTKRMERPQLQGPSAQLSDRDAALEPVKLSVHPAVTLPGSMNLDKGLNISEPQLPPI